MPDSNTAPLSRRRLLSIFAATAVTAAPFFTNAPAYARGAGNIRHLSMFSPRTGERMEATYWIDGDYIPEVLREITYFMRDWRNGQTREIDTRTVDIMAATHRMLDADEAYVLISGYRSPETNAMLRRRSSGVARNSRHLYGEAADLRLQSRSVSQIARAATACRAGGVGRYTGSDFVHMDCGPVRSWGS
ncbi:Tat pathway signal protein [Rhodobacteraceae bacterium WD3A24]|nr:Tat pathway signal protein [Rhodobacteraceae bacterium WD3A24]